MARPSTQHVVSAAAAFGACGCVLVVLASGLVASPAGLLVLLAFLSFASLPALAGTTLLAIAGRSLLRGGRPLGQLVASAVLLAPGAAFATWIGVASLRPRTDVAPGTLAASRVALVGAPLGMVLAVLAPLLLVERRRPRLRPVSLIAWGNVVVLVLATGVLLGWPEASP